MKKLYYYTNICLYQNQVNQLLESMPAHKVQHNFNEPRTPDNEREGLIKGFLNSLLTLPIDSEVCFERNKQGNFYEFIRNNKKIAITIYHNESKETVNIIHMFLNSTSVHRFHFALKNKYGFGILKR